MAGSGWKRPSFRSRQGSEGWSSLGPQKWVGVAGERPECPQNRRDVGNESGVAQDVFRRALVPGWEILFCCKGNLKMADSASLAEGESKDMNKTNYNT